MSKRLVTLIDPQHRRRAALCFSLSAAGWHVEPLEAMSEMSARPPQAGVLLVADEGELVDEVLADQAPLFPPLPIIAFSPSVELHRVVQAVGQGARGYLTWPFEPEDFAKVAASAQASLAQQERSDPLTSLTSREREVFEAAAAGMTSRSIGQQLAISRRTVDAHRLNLLNKMGVGTIAEAVRIARGGSIRARG